jgi:hypothetical protein
VDCKLQLELIPYGSDTFSVVGFDRAVLRPHFERILRVIAAQRRDYVICCGVVFAKLLRDSVVREHSFHLTKNDGSQEVQTCRFANLRLVVGDGAIRAGLAHSWARRGIPMGSYAAEIRARYHEGEPA